MPTINLMNMTPEEIAMGAARGTARGAVDSSYRSLVPVMPTAPSLPARPVYTEPAKEVFDWNVPVSERPAGTENWIWSKSRWAKDNWDREQQAKADAAYKQYQLDLMAWQDEAERKQREYEQQATAVKNYYDTQGLVAPLPGDPTPIIRQAGAEWQKAKAAGNQQAMNYWHGVAEQARIGAGWGSGGADGSLTARYMTNAGLPTWERQYKDTAYQDALKQQELENAMKVAALAAKGRGGGSGSGGSAGTKATFAQATRDAKAAVWQYNNPEEAITAFKSYVGDMAAQGVDTDAVFKEMQRRWPHFDFGTNLNERRALEEAGYVYINGKWVKKPY